MRLTLFWRGRDVIDVEAHLWRKRPTPKPVPAPAEDEGPTLRASGHLQSSQIAPTMEPDTTTFGFGRR